MLNTRFIIIYLCRLVRRTTRDIWHVGLRISSVTFSIVLKLHDVVRVRVYRK